MTVPETLPKTLVCLVLTGGAVSDNGGLVLTGGAVSDNGGFQSLVRVSL